MFKTVRSLFTLIVVALCVSASFSAYAGIGAEPSNQPSGASSSEAMPLTSVPAAPEVLPGMETSMMAFSQPSQRPESQTGMMVYQQMPYEQQMPYGAAYGGAAGMLPYQQQGSLYGYDDVSGMMPQQYTNPSQTSMMPSYPSYVPMDQGMPGGGSSFMMPSYQNPAQYGSTPMYGDSSIMPQMIVPEPQYGSPDQVYNQAMQAYRSKDYWTAMAKFREVASMYPQSDLADNAYYWIGEIYYSGKNYPAAIQSFQTVMQMYPQGNKVPDAMLKMGYAYAELRQYHIAKSILNEVVGRFTANSRIRNLAVKKLNQLSSFY